MIEPKISLSITLKGRTLYPKTSKHDDNPRECKPARQIINLSKGECFRIIGTYHYMNVEGNEKTVPVIGIFKK